jgi:hypothetical protein
MGPTATDLSGNKKKYRKDVMGTEEGLRNNRRGSNWNWSLEEDITHDMNKCVTLHCLKQHMKGM